MSTFKHCAMCQVLLMTKCEVRDSTADGTNETDLRNFEEGMTTDFDF